MKKELSFLQGSLALRIKLIKLQIKELIVMFFKSHFCYEGYILRFKSQIKSIIEPTTN